MPRIGSLVLDADGGELFLLEWAHELSLLLDGLESTVTELGGGIDALEVDLLQVLSLVVNQEWLSEEDWSLSHAHARSLDHDEVVLDLTVVWEATNGVDALFGQVGLGRTVVHVDLAALGLVAGAQSVDLLVDLDSVVVTLLTTSSNGVADSGWMPSTNTGDLSETSMRLSGELLGAPSAGYTLSSVTLGDTDAVGVVVLGEDGANTDLLLEEALGEVDLVGAAAAVDLELDDVCLLLFEWQELHLGVGDESDDLAVLFDLVDGRLLAGLVLGPLLLVLGEGELLGLAPVLVESSLGLVTDVLSPDGLEGSEASWGFDVSDDTDADHWWGVDDGDWLDDLLLVELMALSSDFSNDVGHTGLVTDEAGQVDGLALVVLGVGLESAQVSSASLSWEESLATVSWCLKLSMRHFRYL
jgi:hypothetical protein